MKKLFLPTEIMGQIQQHCEASYPLEACGLLIGRHDVNIVTEVIPSGNLSPSPEKSFEIDPALIVDCHKKSRNGGNKIIGHYHSHPDGDAEPSVHDEAQNYDRDMIWLIIQVTDGKSQAMKAFCTDRAKNALTAIPLLYPEWEGKV
ncbi:MAG: M67 family metallopeptidase [Emcibacter sp.]|nr:M67 family metallopeptidase [Emcibacter sp.]